MRRFLSILALVVIVPTIARASDPRVFDITAEPVPAIANNTAAATQLQNWKTVQGLIDREGAKGPMIVQIPSGVWSIGEKPLVVAANNVTLRGAGRSLTTLQSASASSNPVVISGVRPTFRAYGLTSADFTDANPILDGSTMGLGIVLGRSFLDFAWQPFSMPGQPTSTLAWDAWQRTPAFMLSIAIDVGQLGLQTGVETYPVCGLANRGNLEPFTLTAGQGRIALNLQTSDGVRHKVLVAGPNLSGLVRLTVAVDADAGTVRSWVNRVPFPVAVPPSFATGNKTLASNTGTPFKVAGAARGDGSQTDSAGIAPGFSFVLYGLHLSRLKPAPDWKPGTDKATLRTLDLNTIGFLPLDDDPAYVMLSRCVKSVHKIGGGNLRGCGFMLDASATNNFASVSGLAIEDLTIRNSTSYGHTVALGLSLQTLVRDTTIAGGAVGLGNFTCGSSYLTTLLGRCEFSGAVHALMFYDSIVDASAGQIVVLPGVMGVSAIKTVRTDFRFTSLYMLGHQGPSTRYFADIHGNFSGRLMLTDNETGGGVMDAVIRADLVSISPMTVIAIDDLMVSNVSPGGCLVLLENTAKADRVGILRIGVASVRGGASMRGWFDVRDSRWSGKMVPEQTITGVPSVVGVMPAPVAPIPTAPGPVVNP